MVVYNITVKIDPQIDKQWIKWQQAEHIPEMLATGLFVDHKFFRLLEQDETEGITYVIQFFASSIDHYNKYIDEFAPFLREKSFKRWNERFIAFQTVMEVVN